MNNIEASNRQQMLKMKEKLSILLGDKNSNQHPDLQKTPTTE